MNNISLFLITFSVLVVSALIDWDRTKSGLHKGWQMLKKLLPQLFLLIILLSFFLALFPKEKIATILNRSSNVMGVFIAACLGSVALIPGPIAYPLTAMLDGFGVSNTILAVFVTTLMMVGVLTFPVEKEFLGVRIALLRNIFSFIGAIFIGLLVGSVL